MKIILSKCSSSLIQFKEKGHMLCLIVLDVSLGFLTFLFFYTLEEAAHVLLFQTLPSALTLRLHLWWKIRGSLQKCIAGQPVESWEFCGMIHFSRDGNGESAHWNPACCVLASFIPDVWGRVAIQPHPEKHLYLIIRSRLCDKLSSLEC